MRLMTFGCALAVAILTSMPASASDEHAVAVGVSTYAPSQLGGVEVTPVDRGQDLAIECGCIDMPGADVSVVMALDPVQGEEPTGFQKVLLTEETVGGNAVHVRVPDLPDLVNHTVTLKIYVTSAKGTTACNAGHLRIV
jgi:hypothetical protein